MRISDLDRIVSRFLWNQIDSNSAVQGRDRVSRSHLNPLWWNWRYFFISIMVTNKQSCFFTNAVFIYKSSLFRFGWDSVAKVLIIRERKKNLRPIFTHFLFLFRSHYQIFSTECVKIWFFFYFKSKRYCINTIGFCWKELQLIIKTSEGDSIILAMDLSAQSQFEEHMDKTAHHTIAVVLKEVSE